MMTLVLLLLPSILTSPIYAFSTGLGIMDVFKFTFNLKFDIDELCFFSFGQARFNTIPMIFGFLSEILLGFKLDK